MVHTATLHFWEGDRIADFLDKFEEVVVVHVLLEHKLVVIFPDFLVNSRRNKSLQHMIITVISFLESLLLSLWILNLFLLDLHSFWLLIQHSLNIQNLVQIAFILLIIHNELQWVLLDSLIHQNVCIL